MKYKFVKYKEKFNNYDLSKVIYSNDATTLPELLQEFELFLRACGFIFDGQLEVVEDNLDEPK